MNTQHDPRSTLTEGQCPQHCDPWGQSLKLCETVLRLSCISVSVDNTNYFLDTDSATHRPFTHHLNIKQATEDLQRSKSTTNPLWSDPSEQGIRFPSKGSPRTGKIKWLEIFLVLSYAHRKNTQKQDILLWEVAHKACKYDFYLQCDWISYSHF